MAKNIKGVFDEHCEGLKINRRFVKEIHSLQLNFVSRNNDHVDFFGSPLLGVYPIHYKPIDRERWLNDLLEIEEGDVASDIRELGTVDQNWVRASDVVNLSSVWLLHQLHHNNDLSARDKETAMMDVVLMLQYKFISSIMTHFFPYPADEGVALATHARLNYKYDIKTHGSWGALLQARAKDVLSKGGIHYSTFVRMDDDAAVVYMISDIQARLREIVKKVTKVFYEVRDSNSRISSTSSVVELDDGLTLKDQTRDSTTYIRYLHNVVDDKNTFIRAELLKVVKDAIPSMPDASLIEALEYCTVNHGPRGDKKVSSLIDETLIHAFDYMRSQRGVMSSSADLASLVSSLRNLYMASRMSDPGLLKMRELATKITEKSIKSRNKAVIASVRTGIQIYLVLRAFTMRHYS